ncbi:MAG: LamG-like jellyroll fold domain-containing protein, partial [Acidobacteriota bacterium]
LDDDPALFDLHDVSLLCSTASLPAGASDTVIVPVQLRAPFSGFSPLRATARVESNSDAEPSNDSAEGSVDVEAPRQALFSVQKTAEPADGTDFDFLFNGTVPFALDARDSDDFDGVESFEEFWVPPGTHTVEELTPTTSGWQLESIFCEGPPSYNTVVDVPIEAATWDFDPASIAFAGGSASLVADPLRVGLVGYWRFEESQWQSAAPVLDTSGSGFDGTLEAPNPDLAPGLVGGGADFAGGLISLGQPAALDFAPGADPFSAGVWFKTSSDGALLGKAVGSLAQRQYYLFVFQGRLWVNVGGVQNGGPQQVADDQWHHALVVNADSGGSMEHTLYLDGQAVGTWTSGTGTNGADLLLGARRTSANSGSAFTLDGSLDEAAVWNRTLSAADVADLYALGAGREITADFPTDRPSIAVAAPVEAGVVEWQGVAAKTGAAHAGHLLYQVATADGQWRWWDGGAWTEALAADDVNDASTLNRHLPALPMGPSAELWIRIFFESDGTEPVILDGLRLAFAASDGADATVVDSTATVDLRVGEFVTCDFHNVVATVEEGLTLRMEAPPSDGSDVFFAFPGASSFTLDDAQPDDGDAFGSSITFDELPADHYAITPFAPAGWQFDGADCSVDSEGFPVPFTLDYASPPGHTFDAARLEVDGGVRLVDRLGPGLVGYWSFNAENDFTDASGSGFDAQVIGSVSTFEGEDDATFSGAGALNLGQPEALDFQPSSDPFTLSVWFRAIHDGALVAKAIGTVSQRQFYLFTWQGRLWANVGGVQNGSTTGDLYDGEWHHAAVVNYDDAGTMRHALYLDGALEGTWASGSATNGADLLIGARRTNGNSGTSFSFNGAMDEVKIFDRDLSETEIGDLFALGHEFAPEPRFDASGPSVIAPPIGGGGLNGAAKAVSFTPYQSAGTTGEVRYQLSGDGIDWRHWDGGSWTLAADTDHNDAATVDQHIRDFTSPSGWVWVRAFFFSDGTQPAGLDRIEIEGRDGLDLPTSLDPTGQTFFLRWERGRQATCTFRFSEDNEGATSFVGIAVDTEPADGTNVVFTDWNGSVLTFDDAQPDDGDAYPDSLLISALGSPDEKILRLTDDGGLRPLSFECGGREHFRSPTEVRFQIDWMDRVDCTARLAAGPNLDIDRLPIGASYAVSGDDSRRAWSEGIDEFGAVGSLELLDQGVQRQLVSAVDFHAQSIAFSADGRYLAFQASSDLTGGNPDGEVEVFRIDLTDDSLIQITDTPTDFCGYFWVSVNDRGDVAFTTNCAEWNGELRNPDRRGVIGVWRDGVSRSTALGDCDASSSTLAGASDKPLVLFASNCDPVGLNFVEEQDQLFLWADEDSAVPYRQLTRSVDFDPHYLFAPAFSNDGSTIVYVTDLDPSTASRVRARRLVSYEVATGEHRVIDTFGPGVQVDLPRLSPDGTQLFAYVAVPADPPNGEAAIYSWDLNLDDPPRRLRVNTDGGIDFPHIAEDPVTGRLRLYFRSTADYEGLNPGHSDATWSLLLEP